MKDRIDFVSLAERLGGTIEEISLPNGAVMRETKWDAESGRALLSWADKLAGTLSTGEPVELNGHTDTWALLGFLYSLRKCRLSTYLAVFGQSIPIEAYAVGSEPTEGQPVLFDVEEREGTILLRASAGEPRLPMDMLMSEMVLPPIPEGRIVLIKPGDAKILQLMGLALSLGERCRALFVERGDGIYRCAISHVDMICPGEDLLYDM